MQATEQIREIRVLAREFAERELRPHVERWDDEREIDAGAIAQVAELGFFGMLVPEAHGGMEFDLPTFVAAIEELAWGEPAIALMVASNAVLSQLLIERASDPQRAKWLEPVSQGAVISSTAVAEDEAGSDLAAIVTTAVRSGDGWVLNGEKKWVSHAGRRGPALVLARTGAETLGAFLVPLDAQGIEIADRADTLGLRSIDVCAVRLKDVHVGADALTGGPEAGVEILQARARVARLAVAAVAVGIAQAALDHAVAYANIREQFGRSLRTFEGIQFKLADMATRTAAARAVTQDAAAAGTSDAVAKAKVFAGEAAMWVTTQAVQIFGGYGYMRDYPVEKLMRDAKAMELLEGASEVLRVEIAEALYAHE